MNTDQALEFLIEYLKNKNRVGLLNKNQWEMLKKYKNPQGHTCRDFFNELNNEKMIVLVHKDTEQMSVIPNENFLLYIAKEEVKPLFVYAPFISNAGLTFCFALYKNLKEQQTITTGGSKMVEVLVEKLNNIFIETVVANKDKAVVLLEKDNMILITNYDANLIIDKLEQNNFKFDSDIFNHYKNEVFQPVYPDLLDIKYHFPQDQGKTSPQAMETVFNVLSKGELSDENYTRIRKLIRRMSLEDLNVSKKTALDINLKENSKIKNLFEIEIKRRKLKDFLG
jgi:hypothetical protein